MAKNPSVSRFHKKVAKVDPLLSDLIDALDEAIQAWDDLEGDDGELLSDHYRYLIQHRSESVRSVLKVFADDWDFDPTN